MNQLNLHKPLSSEISNVITPEILEKEQEEDDHENKTNYLFSSYKPKKIWGNMLVISGISNLKPVTESPYGKVKKYIKNQQKRRFWFSRRKKSLIKKAYELATLTGTDILLLMVSETGKIYHFATHRLKPVVQERKGKKIILDSLGFEGRKPRKKK